MKHVITYGIVFTASMALAGVGGYLLTPAKTVQAENKDVANTTPTNTSTVIDEGDDEEEIFIPKESTPVDYLIDNLLNMKSLEASGDIDISVEGYDVSLKNLNVYLTLETFSSIEASVTADISYHGATTPLEISYVGGTIYCSLLGNNIKMTTDDFSDVTQILNEFGVTMETPAIFENVSLDSIMEDMKSMSYSPLSEGGYEFTVNLFGLDIYLTCDNDYMLTSADVGGVLEGIDLGVGLNTTLHHSIERYVEVPETEDRVYQPFNSFLPFVRDIGRLAKETQFGIALAGSVKKSGSEAALEIFGDLQFDINNNSGEGKISLVDKTDTTYVTDKKEVYPTHNLEVNVVDDAMKFKYNEGMYGKFTVNTLLDLFDLVTGFLDSDNPILLLLKDRIPSFPDFSESTINKLINGQYELLFNDYITKLYADDTMLDIVISKDLLGIDGDLELVIGLGADNRITGLTIPGLSVGDMEIEFSAMFTDYNLEYQMLPAENEVKYFDFSEIKVLLALGLDTAEISYFHLKGMINLPMKLLGGIDLSGLASDISLEMEIYNDMSDLSTRVYGKLTNIPHIVGVNNKSVVGVPASNNFYETQNKELEIAYDNEYIYLTRHDIGTNWLGSYKEIVTSTRVSGDDMLKDMNIIKYLLGFGFGMSDSIMETLVGAFTETNPRTEPLDFSKIFNDYVYNTDATVTDYNGQSRTYARNWDIDVNVGELANNSDLEGLEASIYGGPVEGLEGEYLQYIVVDFRVNAGGGAFTCDANIEAELTDIDPNITPDTFESMSSFQKYKTYVAAHQDAQPTTFNY